MLKCRVRTCALSRV